MNKVRTAIFAVSLLILSFIGINKIINVYQTKDLKNKENSTLKESTRLLNECFDMENKNKRTLNESTELIEYCLKEY